MTNIVAYVVDNIGQPVANATVTFSLDSGLKGSLSAATAVTDATGHATVVLTAGNVASTVVVTGSLGSVTANVSVIINGGGGGTITVSATQSNINTGMVTTISATVKDSAGAVVPNTTVTFSLSTNVVTLSATSATTDSSGVATVTVLAGNSGGSAIVTASSLTYGSGTANITVQAPLSNTLSVTALNSTISTFGTTTINALLSGPGFTPPGDGYTVTFSVSNTNVATLSATTAITTNGVASVGLQAGAIAGSVTITATYSDMGINLTNSTTVTITSPPADTVVVTGNPTTIPVYGTSTISALVTALSRSVPNGTAVTFMIDDPTAGALSAANVSTVNGKATTTFTAANKSGTVNITATAASGASGQVSLVIDPATMGSIQFVSAVPQLLGIRVGATTPTSVITFAVKDTAGNPLDGESITFTMNGPGGGECIGSSPCSNTTTASSVNGSVTVILQSGNVAGPVTIVATDPLTGISCSATQVSIGGGVPSATHWNLATSKFNLAGLRISGLTANISAFIGDRFGNYNILQGTTVSFYTEGGAISTQGITDVTGQTSVILRTQDPIPGDVVPLSGEPWYIGSSTPAHQSTSYNSRDGWVTVLATTQGEEAFLDENGDGLFTTSTASVHITSACPAGYSCECEDGSGVYQNTVVGPAACPSGNRSEGFIDLSEPFLDKNDDGNRNDGSGADPFEPYIDAIKNNTFDLPNGRWDGPDCKTTGCQTSKMIWKEIKVAFTGDYTFWPMPDGTNCYSASGGCTATFAAPNFAEAPASITKGTSGVFRAIIGDQYLNALPGGTIITASATEGTVTPTTLTLSDALPYGPTNFVFSVGIDPNTTKTQTIVSVSVSGQSPISVTVPLSAPPLVLSTNVLPTGKVGVAYAGQLNATGGTKPYVVWAVSPAPPLGLAINSTTGAISGTPTAAGTTNFIASVTDSDGVTATKALSITINP